MDELRNARIGMSVENSELNNNGKACLQTARALGISEDFAKLLYARGYKDAQSVNAFLYPSVSDMCPLSSIFGMQAARERLLRALAKKESVLIYGDYDCDGICAVSVLYLFLKGKTEVSYFIPDRAGDGYGLSLGALEKIFAASAPSLVITVDCGISSVSEVEYIKSRGADVIVTDHHEPKKELPNCVVVNAKLGGDFKEYCGAGIALRLVEAVSSVEEAAEYADIAAIATIADVVPLVGDNRIIASEGLRMINENPRTGIRLLTEVGKSEAYANVKRGGRKEKIGSYSVMFQIAPRINAAGRLDNAMKAVDLFVSEDYFLLKSLAEELERDNSERQRLCDEIYCQASDLLKGIDFDSTRIIVLENSDWEAGVLGIVASRLTERFKCPAILFASDGDMLKGSARSVAGINIFELLSVFSDCFSSFGGHAQAAGMSMQRSRFQYFKTALNAYALKKYDDKLFLQNIKADAKLDINADMFSLAKELELLEPTGYGNKKPCFAVDGKGLVFQPIGSTPHVKYSSKGFEIVAFSDYAQALGVNRGEKEILLSLGISEFRNNIYAQGVVKNVITKSVEASDDECAVLNLHQLECCAKEDGQSGQNVLKRSAAETYGDKTNAAAAMKGAETGAAAGTGGNKKNAAAAIDAQSGFFKALLQKTFGTLIVCFNVGEYKDLCLKCPKIKGLPLHFSVARDLGVQTSVVIAPSKNFEYRYFKNVVAAGNAMSREYLDYIASQTENFFVLKGSKVTPPYLSDALLREIYVALRKTVQTNAEIKTSDALYRLVRAETDVSAVDFFAALKILAQLSLFSWSERGKIEVGSKKCNLNESAIYRNMRSYGRAVG